MRLDVIYSLTNYIISARLRYVSQKFKKKNCENGRGEGHRCSLLVVPFQL